jgi:hypothetical protein
MRKGFSWLDGGALVLLCLLSVLFYRHIALTNRILVGGDAFAYFYPYRAYAAGAVCSGQVPLWNPYLFMGVPFVANPQAAVFYPLNLALCWLSAPKLLAWSIVAHVSLAACFAFLYARHSLRLSRWPALLGAIAFAFGGFLSGQAEHINQLNVSAWFPLLLLLWDLGLRKRCRGWALPALGLVVGLGLLAGHTQSSYISLAGLGVYALWPALPPLWSLAWAAIPGGGSRARSTVVDRQTGQTRPPGAPSLLAATRRALSPLARALFRLGLACLLAAGLAAIQLAPTVELARASIRSGGLDYREAVAFSLKPLPRLLRYTFLPPWGDNLAAIFGGSYFTEYLAYVGLVPLALFGVWLVGSLWSAVRRWPSSLHETRWDHPALRMLVLGALGVFLALGLYNPAYLLFYKLVPGFGLFRVPARWLFLYAFGVAMLAGTAAQWAADRLRTAHAQRLARLLPVAMAAIAVLELVVASRALPFSYPTAPEAFSALRTAPSHILAAQRQAHAPGRFLSLSDTLFDPGDLAEMQRWLAPQLPHQAVYDYVVAVKAKEIIAPNLPLVWKLYAVDGYGGGLLPLSRYVDLLHLLLDADDVVQDGRLREGLDRVPPSRLLSILGARYVITDKVNDVWIDDVFYDLAFDAVLGAGTATEIATEDVPRYQATGLGIVSYLDGARALPDGAPVADVRLTTEGGETRQFTLHAGRDTAEGRYEGDVRHAQARIGRAAGDSASSDYIAVLRWEEPVQIARIEVATRSFGGQIHVRGLALIDARDGSSVPLILSTDGQFRQVHSGDVKVYEALDALPRAYVVHHTRVLDDRAALAALADTSFDPARTATLAAGRALDGHPQPAPGSQVTVTHYAPERIRIQAATSAPGYLVLSDAWYPGWQATVDGSPATIERANVHFRALYLEPGTHTVRLVYRPFSLALGAGISLATAIGLVVVAAIRGYAGAVLHHE